MGFLNALNTELHRASGTLWPRSLHTRHNTVLQVADGRPSYRKCMLVLPGDRAACITATAAATGQIAEVLDQSNPETQHLAKSDGRRRTKSKKSSGSSSGSSSSRPRTVERPQPQPFLVRIAGRTSDVKGASGAIVKRLRSEDQVRVAAIDEGSIFKAMITLTAANTMIQANNGQMLVFQPTVIAQQAAEPPRLPEGSMVMYTSHIMQGEVMTFNTLKVMASTQMQPLAKAIIARMLGQSHTVLECYGQAALVLAVQALAQARKGLLVRGQDVACIISSTSKAAASAPAAVSTDSSAGQTAANEGSSSSSSIPQPDGPTGAGGGRRPPLCHRLVLLECEPRNPRALLVRATMGVTDRTSPLPKKGLPPQQPQS